MNTTRQAVMLVDMGWLMPRMDVIGRTKADVDAVSDLTGKRLAWLASMLCLPPDAKVTGVSLHITFLKNQVCVRLSHPSFAETPECHPLPEVKVVYGEDGTGRAYFQRFSGDAVGKGSA